MASFAQDPPCDHVPAVRKVDMVGHPGHPLPEQRLSSCEQLDEKLFLWALTECLLVATQTDFAIGKGGVIRVLGSKVAFRTGDFFLGYMGSMLEGDRLFGLRRCSARSEEHERRADQGRRPLEYLARNDAYPTADQRSNSDS